MTKKTTKQMTETETTHTFCDMCGKETTRDFARSCNLCGRDLCKVCVRHFEYTEDYPIMWCQKCWDIGATHRPKIANHKTAIETLYDEWQTECVKQRADEDRQE